MASFRNCVALASCLKFKFDGRDRLTLDLYYVVHSLGLFAIPSLILDMIYISKSFFYNQRLYLLVISSSETPPSCIDRFVAALTAEIVAERKPLSMLRMERAMNSQ